MTQMNFTRFGYVLCFSFVIHFQNESHIYTLVPLIRQLVKRTMEKRL